MLKKSRNYNGSILLESLISLSIMCFVIISLSDAIISSLKKTDNYNQKLLMRRFVYEAMKEYELYGESSQKNIHYNNALFQIEILSDRKKVSKVSISDGKELFEIEK